MGELYLAAAGERGLEKLCVIKKVLPHLVDEDGARRFRDEAKVVVRLSHGNLVTVFDAGKVDGELYIAMDFVEGRDLVMVWNRCAERRVAFPVDISVYIAKELARGLGYAHGFAGLDLVHRDVSPGNVLLTYSGEVKLTDFGLATSTLKMEQTAPGVIYGKVSYLSPEQARRDRVDARTDVYATGIILWEMLTGQPYLRRGMPTAAAADPMQMLERARKPEPVAPSQLTARVPPELDRVVMKALAPDPDLRFSRAEDLRAELAAFLARTAPATDADHLAGFMRQLFADEIEREREARDELLAGAQSLMSGPLSQFMPRQPAATPPPTPVPAPADRRTPQPLFPPATADTDNGQPPSQPVNDGAGDDPWLGTTIAGRYFLQRLVGSGGMGRVYDARHVEIGKRFAVKILHRSYRHDGEAIERFRREARAASKIGHPNIVDVTDAGVTRDGSLYFAMELLEGLTLEQLISEHGPLPVDRTVLIAAQVCRALQAAHAADVIHRDLKPANVMLVRRHDEPDEHVKVLDFGISRDLLQDAGKGLTGPNVAVGTPLYMSPEQVAGLPPGPAADIYAVGELLYEMLTGCPPFEAEDMLQLLAMKGKNEPLPLRRMRPEVPARLEAIVLKALARAPEDRQPSMASLKDELLGYLEAQQKTPVGFASRLADVLMGGNADETRDEPRPISPRVATEVQTMSTRSQRRRRQRVALIAVGAAGMAAAVGAGIATGRRLHRIESAAVQASEAAARAARQTAASQPSAPPGPAPKASQPQQRDSNRKPYVPTTPPRPAATPLLAAPAALPREPAAAERLPPVTQPVGASRAPAPAPARAAVPRAPTSATATEETAPPSRAASADPAVRAAAAGKPAEDRSATSAPTPPPADQPVRRPDAGALMAQCKAAFSQGSYPEAIRRGKQALMAGAGSEAHVLLGDVYFNMERFRDALMEYEAALRTDPGNAQARRGRDLARARIE